jgi:enamine deaminase RidA (YjgF/YER057c/UK114 family)
MEQATQVMQQSGREVIWPEGFPRTDFTYSPGVRAGGWVFASAQLATDLVTGLSREAQVPPGNPYSKDPVELQSWAVMKNLADVMSAAGCDINRDSVRIQQWRRSDRPTLAELEQGKTWTGLSVSPYYRARNSYIDPPRPASTGMGVRRLLLENGRIGVDLIAMHPDAGPGKRGVGVPDEIAAPIAGFSPAICNGDWVFLAGEVPTDWAGDWMSERYMGMPSGVAPEARVNPFFWYGSQIESQTDYTLKRLDAIARNAGTSLDRCVKANVYIPHPNDYHGMDRVWSQWFADDPPARVVIPYMGLGVMGCRIEIDMILLAGDSELPRRAITTDAAFEPFGHEPQAMQAGNFVFFSTQLPCGPDGVESGLVSDPELPFVADYTRRQARRMFDNLAAICEAAGTRLEDLCQIREFYQSLASFPGVREEWRDRFGDAPPASTTVEVGAPLIAPGAHLLMDVTGYVPTETA